MQQATETSRTRVAVITGGTMGIGRATAVAFARAGWSVAVLARGEERLRSTDAELKALGVSALCLAADVADAAAVEAAATLIEEELGPVEAWVNNAMATVVSPAEDITPEEYRRVTEVTYLGQVFGTLAALRLMRKRGKGAIVQVSSGLGVRSAPLQSAYCGAKAAVGGFTDSLRAELLHQQSRITLTTVYLPAVNTPQFRRTRNHTGLAQTAPDPVYDPRLCAEAILHAVRSPRREVWVGRSTVQMALAQAVAPGFADRQAAGMWDAQLDPSMPPPDPKGNLFDVDADDPGIDGPFTDRTKPQRGEFVTSQARELLTAGVAVVALLGVAALLAPAAWAAKHVPGPHRTAHRTPHWPTLPRRTRW